MLEEHSTLWFSLHLGKARLRLHFLFQTLINYMSPFPSTKYFSNSLDKKYRWKNIKTDQI